MNFEWDSKKDGINVEKHGVQFEAAKHAFYAKKRIIAEDIKHVTNKEKRYFCFGKVNDRIMTVRFTIRGRKIRIFGAGYWREGAKKYEK